MSDTILPLGDRKVTRQVFCTIDGRADDARQDALCDKLADYARKLGFDVAQDQDDALR